MTNQTLTRKIALGERSYNVIVGDKLSNLGEEMSKPGLKGKALILSHPRIMRLHGKALIEGLRNHFDTAICEIPEGEKYKSREGLDLVFNAFEKNKIKSKDIIILFCGGVIGDLGGYAAASWSRGIKNIIQVPTTLIAQTDSSIGGKTGIDWGRIKNKVGAFRQPNLVFIDISTLSTLSKRQFNNGMAEVIKYGLLNEKIWNLLQSNKSGILARNPEILAKVIWECTNLKCDLVENDEFDTKGIRAKLNLGHTVGHGVEGASNFKLLHGESISLGLIAAARLSMKKLGLDKIYIIELVNLLKYFDLPISFEGHNKKLILDLIKYDKKIENGKPPPFILFDKIGNATFPHYVTEKEIRQTLNELS